MSGYELRPLSLGELLDRAFLLYRRSFGLFIGIMAIPACFVMPARFFYLKGVGVPIPWQRSATPIPPHASAYSLIFIAVDFVVYALAQAATTYAVADIYLGRVSTVRLAYERVFQRFWRVIGISLNVGLRVFGLMILLILGVSTAAAAVGTTLGMTGGSPVVMTIVVVVLVLGAFALTIAFAMRYALCLPAVLLEELTGGAAIRRSAALTEGRRGRIFVAVLLSIVVLYAMAILFQGPFYAVIAVTGIKGHVPVWLIAAMTATSTLGGVLAGPLLMIILVLCYYDSRVRKEAFDLQQMMAAIPAAGPAAAPSVS